MQISYCKKCHDKKRLKNINDVISDLKSVSNECEVELRCLSYCGPGNKTNFCMIDDIIIEDENYDAFIKKVGNSNDN